MSAGLVDGRDLVIGEFELKLLLDTKNTTVENKKSFYLLYFLYLFFLVAANLQKIVDDPQTNKNVTFKLVSYSIIWCSGLFCLLYSSELFYICHCVYLSPV